MSADTYKRPAGCVCTWEEGDSACPVHPKRGGSESLWIEKHTRQWSLKAVKRLCESAGVPVVSAHGLRGTLATLATAAGVGLLDLSKMLGHADGGKVATQHYIAKGTGAAAARERGMMVLNGGKK